MGGVRRRQQQELRLYGDGAVGWQAHGLGSLPPYGALNYCVNASIQFFKASLIRIGNNIRLSQHSFDPQLNSPHSSCASCTGTFIGDYFGNTSAGSISYSSFVSTYDDSSNPFHYQQQVVANLSIP